MFGATPVFSRLLWACVDFLLKGFRCLLNHGEHFHKIHTDMYR